MHWGNRLILAFVLFAAFIIYMVVRAFQEDFDLVTEDYYEQEINYQKKLEQKANQHDLEEKVLVSLEEGTIKLVFPTLNPPSGKIHFYHPANKDLDRIYPIATDTNFSQLIPDSVLIKGHYRVNITWISDGTEYFQQEKIYIQ